MKLTQKNKARLHKVSGEERMEKFSLRNMKKAAWLGQVMFGMDNDLIMGQDDGERIEGRPDLDLSDRPAVEPAESNEPY